MDLRPLENFAKGLTRSNLLPNDYPTPLQDMAPHDSSDFKPEPGLGSKSMSKPTACPDRKNKSAMRRESVASRSDAANSLCFVGNTPIDGGFGCPYHSRCRLASPWHRLCRLSADRLHAFVTSWRTSMRNHVRVERCPDRIGWRNPGRAREKA